MNQTEAYKKACANGVKDSAARVNASKLMRTAHVVEYIQKQQEKISRKTDIQQEDIVMQLAILATECMKPVPVMDRNGTVIGSRVDSQGANKALETLAKIYGMMDQKVTVSGGLNNTIQDLTNLSSSEIDQRISDLSKRFLPGSDTDTEDSADIDDIDLDDVIDL